MKKLDVLMVYDGDTALPPENDFEAFASSAEWGTEIAVCRALKSRGHALRFVNFYDDLAPLLAEVRAKPPDIVFNLAEACLGEYHYDKNLPSLFELLSVPYTGCGPVGLMICNDKAITKKILVYHGVKVPRFAVYRIGESVKFPKEFAAPFIVKPLQEEASTGIAQRSFAENEEQCRDRVRFVHESLKRDAMVEEYIDGRELYVGVLGNGRNLKILPPWELKFTRVPEKEPKIATYHAKWDEAYREKWGIKNELADPLPEGIGEKLRETCRKAYRVLNLDGYARFDLRLTPGGEISIIEANANPELAPDGDLAASAGHDGMSYEELVEKILHLGLHRSTAE